MNKISLIITVIIVLIDLYAYKGMLKTLPRLAAGRWIVPVIYFSITAFFVASVWLITRYNFTERRPEIFAGFYTFAGFFLLIYVPKIIFAAFHFTEDLYHLAAKAVVAVLNATDAGQRSVTRFHFLSVTGLIVAGIPFLAMIYGMTFGRFNYTVEKTRLVLPELPESFNGLRIVQISDLHLGSLVNQRDKIVRAISLINSQHPDLIFFTGDMVNNFSEEALGWEDLFSGLTATYGKYSVLGNHDYGDYWQWANTEEKRANLDLLADLHQRMGFRLLMNESATIINQDDSIVVVGVENWGKPPFKQHGDLNKALTRVNGAPFKILLSHDPSHWDAEVAGKTSIQLTLSGHTHAAQFGIRIRNFRWSLSQYVYKKWNGLYRHEGQYLYVNRGLGYIGFPGRVGMPPEITLLELFKEVTSDE